MRFSYCSGVSTCLLARPRSHLGVQVGTRVLAVPCVYSSVSASWLGSEMASRCVLALRQALSLGLGGQWEKVKTAYAAANRALGDIVKVRHLGHSHFVVESSLPRALPTHTVHACLSTRCRTHPRVLSSDTSAVVRANTHVDEPD